MEERLGDPNLTAKERIHLQDQINLVSKVTGHKFGDTKHRHVDYHVTATSRYRSTSPPL